MRSSVLPLLPVLAALALTAACGEQPGSAPSPAAPSTTERWGDCTSAAFDAAAGPGVEVPTSGGATVTVKLPGAGPCAGALVVRTPDGVSGTDVGDLDLDGSTAQVVHLGGAPAALLRVDGGAHPRGGFQPHLFAVEGEPGEVTLDAGPLLPFVATDGGMAPMTATCTGDGGVAVLSATTSEPPGVVLAWDVERTTYRIDGTTAQQVETEQVRDHAADPVLRREVPELFEPGSLFAGC